MLIIYHSMKSSKNILQGMKYLNNNSIGSTICSTSAAKPRTIAFQTSNAINGTRLPKITEALIRSKSPSKYAQITAKVYTRIISNHETWVLQQQKSIYFKKEKIILNEKSSSIPGVMS